MGSTASRPIAAWMTVLLLPLGAVATTPPASANTDVPPPVPGTIDRSGADQDEFVVPDNQDYYYMFHGEQMLPGPNSANGEAHPVIETAYFNERGTYTVGPTYTLDYDTAVTGTEAADRHASTVLQSTCRSYNGVTDLQMVYTNVDDVTDRYKSAVELEVRRVRDGHGPPTILRQTKILDGETRQFGRLKVEPGVYRVLATVNGAKTREMLPRLTVPGCSTGGGGTSAGGTLTKAAGKVVVLNKQVGKTRVVMKAARGTNAPASTGFRIKLRKPDRTSFRFKAVPAGATKRAVFARLPARTVVLVQYRDRPGHYKTLARSKV